VVNLDQQRADVVDAIDGVSATVDGVTVTLTGHRQQPHPVMAWDTWPVWQNVRPITVCIAETDWNVCVALPGADAESTTAAGDALVDPVAEALDRYLITGIQPGQLVVADAATVPILIFAITI